MVMREKEVGAGMEEERFQGYRVSVFRGLVPQHVSMLHTNDTYTWN